MPRLIQKLSSGFVFEINFCKENSENGSGIILYKCKTLKENARKCLNWSWQIYQDFNVLIVRLRVRFSKLFSTNVFLLR